LRHVNSSVHSAGCVPDRGRSEKPIRGLGPVHAFSVLVVARMHVSQGPITRASHQATNRYAAADIDAVALRGGETYRSGRRVM
jgi:hypothetical protein